VSDSHYDLAIVGAGQLLGGQLLGGQITLAIKLNATAEQLTETIFAHPTLSEAAEALFAQATHLPKARERK